jgi:predicted enzyme related to lactoylglutathione lyase
MADPANPVVHLQLRTPNLPRATAFYTQLFGWRAENVRVCSKAYLALELGRELDGGVVERDEAEASWLPYVEVPELGVALARARRLGARVVVGPREGPAGWRAVIEAPDGAEIAFWQQKSTSSR